MAASARQDLFLNITGSADNLTRIAKAAKVTLADLGAAAGDLQKTMADNFQKLGGSELAANTRTIEASFRRTFANIRASAEASIGKPITAESILSSNIGSAQASLSAAQAQAAALRELADAQARLIASNPAVTDGERALAVTLEGSALAAKEKVIATELEIASLQALAAESGVVVDANNRIIAGHGQMSASGAILQHVVRSTADSFAAGLPPTMIFAEQIGRLGEAAALSGGAMGAFGEIMAGPWGLAITAAISVASILAKTLLETHDAAKLAQIGSDGLADAQGVLGKMFDLTSGKLEHQNDLLRLNAELTAVNLRAQASQERSSSAKTFGSINDGSESWKNFFLPEFIGQEVGAAPRQLLAMLKAGKLTPAEAIKRSETVDMMGSQITREQFQQAIVDATSAKFKDQTADKIESTLASGKLDPEFQNESHRRSKVDHSTERAANKDRAYQSQLDQAQSAYGRALADLADTAEGRLQVEQQELWASLQQKNLELDDQVAAGKLTQAQADHLKEIYAGTEELQEINALQKQRSQVMHEQLEKDQAYLESQVAMLQLQQDLAIGSRKQRDLALQIFAKQEEESRNRLTEQLNDPTSTAHDREMAQQGLDRLDAEHPYKIEQINRQTASPIEAYRQQLRQNVGDMNDALEGVAVDGLKGLEDGLTGLISGTESVSSAFKKMASSIVADLARIAIEKLIVNTIGGSFFGLAGGGKVDGFARGGIPGFATGAAPSVLNGLIRGPGTGTSDSILALLPGGRPIRVSNGESIVKASATRRYWPFIKAMNDDAFPGFATGGIPSMSIPPMRDLSPAEARTLSQPAAASPAPIHFDLRGAVMTPDLLRQMQEIANHTGGQVLTAAVTHTNDSLRNLSRPRL